MDPTALGGLFKALASLLAAMAAVISLQAPGGADDTSLAPVTPVPAPSTGAPGGDVITTRPTEFPSTAPTMTLHPSSQAPSSPTPVIPTTPTEPSTPATPTEPAEPTEPDAATETPAPAGPTTPTEPVTPGAPTTPAVPTTPTVPGTPATPDPAAPAAPAPAAPGAPSGEIPAGGNFAELPVGAALPSEEECAARVQRNAWEPRPENEQANNTVPPQPVQTQSWGEGAELQQRVTGNFTGTTDEIIQWASCKWGFETDITRAQAVRESTWKQSANGDGGESFGLLQIKSTAWEGTHPHSENSTAFNADWSLGWRRACFEGAGNGDIWACIGQHYSGRIENDSEYVQGVKSILAEKPWLGWESSGGESPTPDRTGGGGTPTTPDGGGRTPAPEPREDATPAIRGDENE